MNMSERIRRYIESNGLKFNFVADKCGIEPKKFYRLISGKTAMSVDEYERICTRGLSLAPSYFFETRTESHDRYQTNQDSVQRNREL